jgi:hypothetical protein
LAGNKGFNRSPLSFFDDVPAEGLKLMNRVRFSTGMGLLLAFMAVRAEAVTVPFSEDFATDSAKWKNTASANFNWSSSGGPDGGNYVSANEIFKGQQLSMGLIVFRGQDFVDSSNDGFVGNWLAAGVGKLTAYVRQDTGQPLSFFGRIVTQNNFPGVTLQLSTVVPSNTWTKIEFDLSPANPLVIPEGGPGSYIISAGTTVTLPSATLDGAFAAPGSNSAPYTLRLKNITDGTSKTFLVGDMNDGIRGITWDKVRAVKRFSAVGRSNMGVRVLA